MKRKQQITGSRSSRQRGVTLLEVLVTILIIAFGVLGLIGMNVKVQAAQSDSYQRAQAILLVQDMAGRLAANRANALSYVTTTPLGTGDGLADDCAGMTGVTLDKCEWSNELRGAGERLSGTSNVGAMTNALGCISRISTNPSVYQVTVAWQGTTDLGSSSLTCGSGNALFARDTLRRAISVVVPLACVTAPTTACAY
jgi:type IV pilus assembly protein PilV